MALSHTTLMQRLSQVNYLQSPRGVYSEMALRGSLWVSDGKTLALVLSLAQTGIWTSCKIQ